ncbi:MAG: hypothetical protein DCC55_32935 [Chloroflexi bacterium]|nr:MAG: hypothetical protein DCC55_32935 [Chloroflexota bacterium]
MVKNSFDRGPEGWCTYDYHASVIAGNEMYFMTTWQRNGGVNDSGYIFTDHYRWSADTPENPVSILALLHYHPWVGGDPIDLRDTEVSCYLRGDGLNLNTAKCYFWVNILGNRWHLHSQPIPISDGRWADAPTVLRLTVDESKWYRSWSHDPDRPARLADVLARAASYGFSFVGFGSEVTGRLSLDEFEIRTR